MTKMSLSQHKSKINRDRQRGYFYNIREIKGQRFSSIRNHYPEIIILYVKTVRDCVKTRQSVQSHYFFSRKTQIYTKKTSFITTTTLVSLPRKSGRHVEQDAPPLLPQMELPDPCCPISTSTHKPETGQRQKHFAPSLYTQLHLVQYSCYEKQMVSKYKDFTIPFT